jgi:hypothetical protein
MARKKSAGCIWPKRCRTAYWPKTSAARRELLRLLADFIAVNWFGRSIMAEGNMCTIRVIRPSLLADRIRSYLILLNGKVAGSIGNNSTVEIAAPAGAITIEAKIDWGRSNALTINTVPGQTIEVEVRNYWGPLLALWAITFGKNSYLRLTQRSAAATG